jgi:hypothetical protein
VRVDPPATTSPASTFFTIARAMPPKSTPWCVQKSLSSAATIASIHGLRDVGVAHVGAVLLAEEDAEPRDRVAVEDGDSCEMIARISSRESCSPGSSTIHFR